MAIHLNRSIDRHGAPYGMRNELQIDTKNKLYTYSKPIATVSECRLDKMLCIKGRGWRGWFSSKIYRKMMSLFVINLVVGMVFGQQNGVFYVCN